MDYTQYDYQALVNEITTRFSETEGWTSAYQTETGQRLIQLFADATDSLHFMLERRSQEAFIDTAVLRRSVISHASEMGYRIRRTTAMTGNLTIDLTDIEGSPLTAEAPIVIPKFTRIKNNATLVDFVTTKEVTIRAGVSTATIPVKEGSIEQIVVDTESDEFQETLDVTIPTYEDIDEYSILIEDADGLFYDVESSQYNFGTLGYAGATDPVYDIRYSVDGMRLVFGNGVTGKKPRGTMTIQFVRSELIANSFAKTGSLFSFDQNYLTDTSGTLPSTQYYYSLVNNEQIRGYLPVESIGVIVENAKESLRSNSRMVLSRDYEYIGSRSGIGGVVDVKAYGEQETSSIIFNMNNVYMTYATSDGVELTADKKNELMNYFNIFKPVTVHPVLSYANRIEVKCDVVFKKNTRLPLTNEEAYALIKERIEAFFIIQRGSIGKDLQHSELVSYLDEQTTTIDGTTYYIIDYVKVNLKPLYNIGTTVPLYSTRISLSDDYVINAGDTLTMNFNGDDITVTVEVDDTKYDILDRFRETIATDTQNIITQMETVGSDPVIRLLSRYADDFITVIPVSGQLAPYTSLENTIRIPSKSLLINNIDDVVVPGSVKVVDSALADVFVDDGTGNLVPTAGGISPTINYKTFDIYGLYLTDTGNDYYVTYEQNEFQNIDVDSRSVLVLSPFADTSTDTPLYSTITVR